MELQGFIQEFQAKIVTPHIIILEIRYPGIAKRAKACRMFLVLEGSLKTRSIYLPGSNYNPRDPKTSDGPYQLCSRAISMRCNADVETFAEADIVSGVMKLVFEVDQINVHLHGHLQTKAGLLM